MKTNTLRSILALSLCASPIFAASNPSTPSSPTASAYTNDSQKSGYQSDTTQVISPTYFPPSPWAGTTSLNSGFFSGSTSVTTYRYNKQTIYFPPDAMPLGYYLNPASAYTRMSTARNTVLTVLSPYVSEFFYTPLSCRVHDESIPDKVMTRIADYRTQRMQLLSTLRQKLEALRMAEPAQRKAQLAELAQDMDPQILALEAKAEEIRKNLTSGGVFEPKVDWNENRSWRLGDDTTFETFQDEYLVMRATAFLQVGLSTDQRLLLREIARDLQRRSIAPTADLELGGPAPYFSFSPFTSRFRLPLELPAELASKIAQYRERKESMKDELRRIIYDQDKTFFKSARNRAIADFNRTQAAEFASLEQLAEEIREGLAGVKLPDEPKPISLNGPIADRLGTYLREKTEFQRKIVTRFTELKAKLPGYRVELDHRDNGARIVIEPRRGAPARMEKIREEEMRDLPAFNAELSATFMHLSLMRERLKQEISAENEKKTGKRELSIDQMINSFSRSFMVQENWNRYAEYRTAVLEPGLSPAQRRLLYTASLETLMVDVPR